VPGHLVLWDVDHTLIDAGGGSQQLYGVVFAELFGRELPAVAPMAGRTDRAIIAETLTQAGIAGPDQHVAAFLAGLRAQAAQLGELVRLRGRVLPGVVEAIAALADGQAPGQVVQSVLTGNTRALAEAKLGALGLAPLLDMAVGAYGDSHAVRAELVHLARRAAGQAYHCDFGGAATVLIGDTPLDVAAALATGARAVAVASGSFTADELAAAGADAVLPSLSVTADVLAAVFGAAGPAGAAGVGGVGGAGG
jgi:phosphoglycolate phosphatase